MKFTYFFLFSFNPCFCYLTAVVVNRLSSNEDLTQNCLRGLNTKTHLRSWDQGKPTFSPMGLWVRTFRSMKSEIRPGFMISMSVSVSPVSILMTVDMVGLTFGTSWVQMRPTFKNLQASSGLKSPFREVSTIFTNSPCSYNAHILGEKNDLCEYTIS